MLTADYWVRNVTEPVRFADAIRAAATDGHRLFLEIGPHPALSGHVRQCLADLGADGQAVTTLRRGEPGLPRLLTAASALYAAGGTVNFTALYPGPHALASLPTYPWQRRSHWLGTPAGQNSTSSPDVDSEPVGWLDMVASLSTPDREAAVIAAVRSDVAVVLELSTPEDVPVDVPLLEIGLDSLMAVQVRHELSARTGWVLPSSMVFDHPTVGDLARYLLRELNGEGKGRTSG